MTPTQIMAAITTAKQAEKVIKALVTAASKRWPGNELFSRLASVLPLLLFAFCFLLSSTGCMTYIRTANLDRSPVAIEGIRAGVQGQIGVQTRGMHIPGSSEDTTQQGGGRADTTLDIPVGIDRSTATPSSSSSSSSNSTPTSATPVSAVSTGELSGVTWSYGKGFSAPSAQRDPAVTLTLQKVDAAGITYQHTGLSRWEGDPIACLIYANKTAAKFEWAPATRTYRGWENVHGAYGGMPVPAAGEACGFVLVSQDGKWCSNVLPFSWVN